MRYDAGMRKFPPPKRMSTEEMMRRARKAQSDRNYRFKRLPIEKQRVQIAKDVIEYVRAGKITAKPGVYMRLDEWFERTERFLQSFDPTDVDVKEMSKKELERHIADLQRYNELRDKEICDLVDRSTDCNVCGIGAVFVACVKRADKLKFSEFVKDNNATGDSRMREYLNRWFVPEQRGLIENAFERGEFMNEDFVSQYSDEMHLAKAFGKRYKKPEDRLVAIMQNIVDHDGTFVP